MRTVSQSELHLLESDHLQVYHRVDIQNWNRNWVQISAFKSEDFVKSVEVSASIEKATMSATITLRRETDETSGYSDKDIRSISPLVRGSVVDDEFRSLIFAGRGVRIWTAVTYPGAETMSRRLLFLGKIDDVQWGGDNSEVQIQCRDKGAFLLDAKAEKENDIFTNGQTVSPVQALQTILDQTYGAGFDTVISGNASVYEKSYNQINIPEGKSVLNIMKEVAEQRSLDIRYGFDDSGGLRLFVYEPDRDNDTPIYTVNKGDIKEVSRISVSDSEIFNVIGVPWEDNDGNTGIEKAENKKSIKRFGRRYKRISSEKSDTVQGPQEAQAMAESLAKDMGQITSVQQILMPMFWPIELNDYIEIQANGVHYTSNQQASVSGYRHKIAGGHGETILTLKGSPSGPTYLLRIE